MYINKVDEILDKIIDDFYNKVIVQKEFSGFLEEPNFVKYQLQINKHFGNYFDKISTKEINEILKDEDNTQKLINILKKYIAYYVFMYIGFFYKGKRDTYINNVIEFSKNQPGFNLRIDNFFNSDSNSIVIKYYVLIRNIITIVDSESKLGVFAKKPELADALKFLDGLGQEFIDAGFKLKNLNGNVHEQAHNIIKTILLTELYFGNDKNDVQTFLDKSEKEVGEFVYIDIVMPRMEYIDYNTIEMSLSIKDNENGLASEIYDLLTTFEQEDTKEKTHDNKIIELINNNLFIPVTEDFMLYHKDTEKYEKYTGTVNITTQTKKKDETKIKYIINKIDSVTEFHSKNTQSKEDTKKSIEKLFYAPLSDRKGVLVNNFEDVKIINKLQNQGRRAIENNEYFNDLLTYRQYPYINFKDFNKYGLTMIPNKTIDAIRSINFEKNSTINKNKFLEFRVATNNHPINITGFIIPSSDNDIKCLRIRDIVDVRKVGYKENGKVVKSNNGYNNTLRLFKKVLFDNKNRPAIYWDFDMETDKIKFDKYEFGNKVNNNEYIKLMISKLYDDLAFSVNNEIIKYINKKGNLTLQEFDHMLKKINNRIEIMPRNTNLYDNLIKMVYSEKIEKSPDSYDRKDDDFPGLLGEIIKLPDAPKKQPEKMPTIRISKNLSKGIITEDDDERLDAICQHNITWDNINAIRKKNPNKSSELLFEFFQQYIIKNHEDDFICKSCGTQINLRNYVLDGTYDDDGRFVSFNMPMETPLEDIPEYEKYKSSIRNLEKMVDRIGAISNISTLTGTTTTIRLRVRKIVKDALDLLLIHNANLKNIYKERSEKISIYGLNKDLSNLFFFELDNTIFVYSSKDKDFYKPIKRNNILVYLMFLIMLELSDTQMYYMTGDKICNYYLFSKYGVDWFNGIFIRKNNQNAMSPILNYKLLCYLIFYMSCLITKYNLWYTDNEELDKKKKFDPLIQKTIIHTIIDFINSIIEIYGRKKKHYIYDMIANKFFVKLNTVFSDNEILNKIRALEEKKIIDKKARGSNTNIKSTKLESEYQLSSHLYSGDAEWMKCKVSKNFMKLVKGKLEPHYQISNATNCSTGKFHKWEPKGPDCVCGLCGVIANKGNESNEMTKEIAENYAKTILKKIATKYCTSGELHNYIYDNDIECNVCTKCNIKNIDKLSNSELEKIKDNTDKMKNQKNEQQISKNKKDKTQYVNEIKSDYGKTKQHKEDYFKFVDDFIGKIESILGKDVNLNNKNIFLRYDAYVINHDHNGHIIDKPFTITDVGDKILFKKDHSFFKKDVIYYTNFKLQIDIFYDASTKLLLGFKEKNKEFQMSKRQNIYLRVNTSILNRIKLLGYSSHYINVSDKMEYNKKLFKDPNVILANIVSEISRERIQRLKKIMSDMQRYIYKLAYSHNTKPIDEENNPDQFLDKYKNKLGNMILKDKDTKFLKYWKVIKNMIFFESLANKTINMDTEAKYFSIDDITTYDYNGNVILFYIVREMGKLLDFNSDKFMKATISYLLLDILVVVHNEFDEEKDLTNTEIKRFKYTLDIYDDREIEEIGGSLEGYYEEYKDPDAVPDESELEQAEDDREEMEALDVDMEVDDMGYDNIDYAPGVNFNG